MVFNTLTNKKGHLDPICMAFPIVTTVLGIVFLMMVSKPEKMAAFEQYLLLGFLLATFISIVVRTLKHGLAGLSAIIAFTLVVVSLLMFRYALGVASPSNSFFANNIKIVLPVLIAGSWLQQFVP